MNQNVLFQMIYELVGESSLYLAAAFFGFSLAIALVVLVVKIFVGDE